MKKKILEEFDEIILDSYWIRVVDDYEDPVFYLVDIRIRVDHHLKSYYFHGLSEMYQKTRLVQEPKNYLAIDETGNWAGVFMKKNKEKEAEYMEINGKLLKHYIFQIGETEFNILAEGYQADDGFREMFREQEKIKNLVS
ncbi:hypothetical protein LF887_15280 [Chryseobacterium sp. MEBOG06]|uniref:hypothetical protein n=1 Tax=Chryseobacterium sp. MEBOG06 TaxID=2879938 RepID=UPI001F15DEED|nr:hypothetical protein [Chryseobacterium sp. MEBOG06]UKB82366.1 hypothetical protein LF887_15280 [Chryseobacterium sp. MEBOG06]